MFYIEEKRMFGFILEMDYFTMAENSKYFWKTFYITAPMVISGTFELSNKHFNAAAVRGCLTVFGVVIFGNISCSTLQKGCHYITLSEAICKDDVSHRDLPYQYHTEHFPQCSLCSFYVASECRRESGRCSFGEY
jgi:hypothetical protein